MYFEQEVQYVAEHKYGGPEGVERVQDKKIRVWMKELSQTWEPDVERIDAAIRKIGSRLTGTTECYSQDAMYRFTQELEHSVTEISDDLAESKSTTQSDVISERYDRVRDELEHYMETDLIFPFVKESSILSHFIIEGSVACWGRYFIRCSELIRLLMEMRTKKPQRKRQLLNVIPSDVPIYYHDPHIQGFLDEGASKTFPMIATAKDIATVYLLEHERRSTITSFVSQMPDEEIRQQVLLSMDIMESFVVRGYVELDGQKRCTTAMDVIVGLVTKAVSKRRRRDAIRHLLNQDPMGKRVLVLFDSTDPLIQSIVQPLTCCINDQSDIQTACHLSLSRATNYFKLETQLKTMGYDLEHLATQPLVQTFIERGWSGMDLRRTPNTITGLCLQILWRWNPVETCGYLLHTALKGSQNIFHWSNWYLHLFHQDMVDFVVSGPKSLNVAQSQADQLRTEIVNDQIRAIQRAMRLHSILSEKGWPEISFEPSLLRENYLRRDLPCFAGIEVCDLESLSNLLIKMRKNAHARKHQLIESCGILSCKLFYRLKTPLFQLVNVYYQYGSLECPTTLETIASFDQMYQWLIKNPEYQRWIELSNSINLDMLLLIPSDIILTWLLDPIRISVYDLRSQLYLNQTLQCLRCYGMIHGTENTCCTHCDRFFCLNCIDSTTRLCTFCCL